MKMPAHSAPPLADRKAVLAHRRRADLDKGMFLQTAAVDDLEDRLSMVNRTFQNVAIVTAYPEIWRSRFPRAKIIADSDTLDLTAETHDLIIHAMTLHWANDPVGQLIQCRQALIKDGLFMATGFGGQTLHELRAALAQAESECTGGLSPRVLPMAEIRDLGGVLQRAGFALPVADSLPLTVSYETAWHLMQDLRAMGETNAIHGRKKTFSTRRFFMRMSEIYAENFAQDGRIPATFDLIFLSGWAPDDSQPKPLRPGSAAQRLSDALNTKESKL